MNEKHIRIIAVELSLKSAQVQAVATLLAEAATIPFIARYRKESTGSLDEVVITSIRDRLKRLEELDHRRAVIMKSLEQNGHLTDKLRKNVNSAPSLSVLEDIYLPYRPKRRTKATIAREKGLEPLARYLFAQQSVDPQSKASDFIDPEHGVTRIEDALTGARDIIAEMVSEDKAARAALRQLYATQGRLKSRVATNKETVGVKYRDYFDLEESVIDAPSHRILAMRRGEKEDILNLTFAPHETNAITLLEDLFLKPDQDIGGYVRMAIHDSYKRLLSRSMETELRVAAKERADAEAIQIFADNLRPLLLAPPLGAKRVMGVDPGFKTGCKIACLDRQGKLLCHDTVYPHTSAQKTTAAADRVTTLCKKYSIEAVAVGNGTAGRETKVFIDRLPIAESILVVSVDESGASVYSASKLARQEFPELDLTVRGAISIGRRLMDPLSELVKIDPKSIGVGQYQHDVDQTALRQSLDDVVVSCVNHVGVDVNRASTQLLTYVSGLGPQLAANITAFRNANGPFTDREQLRQVPRLGPRAFEQAAGFLRVNGGKNCLDASAVHPESYPVVYQMAIDLDCDVARLMADAGLRKQIDIANYVTDEIGMPTLMDIMAELDRPGRDPRDTFEVFEFADGIEKMTDLAPGMELAGIVTNVTAFGAFVDIGVHQDGLVHISELSHRYVKDPANIVKVHQNVTVKVLEVDLDRNRIALSMKTGPPPKKKAPALKKKRNRKAPAQKSPPQSGHRPAKAPFHNPFAELLGGK